MFANISPNFGKGRILKKEMLENLRDYPRNFLDIYYKDYSNGIISGADICISDNSVIVKKGIIRYKGSFYMLENEFELPYSNSNKEVLIKIKFEEEKTEGDFKKHCTAIMIDDNITVGENEMELGRFKLREGAILRSQYTDFYDFSTEYNTVNLINVEYCGMKKSTLSPKILNYFSVIVLKNNSQNVFDIAFAMQCMNSGLVERETILYYISNRLDRVEYRDYSNIQIYKYLTQIVREIESGVKRKVDQGPQRPTRIIVD